jgi:hypothetical protein
MLMGKAELRDKSHIIFQCLPNDESKEYAKAGLAMVLVVQWLRKISPHTRFFMSTAEWGGISRRDHEETACTPDRSINKWCRSPKWVKVDGIKPLA